jgi:murein DD-endopeptidase MepM/ murein hydrolase activator NlpD
MRAAVVAAAMLLALAGASRAAGPSVVGLDVRPLAAPAPVAGSDRTHLLYELRLSNLSPRPVTLESLEVRDADRGTVLARYDAAALGTMVVRPGAPQPDPQPLTLPAGSVAVAFIDPPVGAATPRALAHRLRIRPDREGLVESRLMIDGVVVPLSTRPPLVLGPPFRGSGWLAANALGNDSGHRRTLVPIDGQARISQRYAIDFVQLDSQGRAYRGEASRNENWVGYGADVLAVADGVVVDAQDGLPDNPALGPRAVAITAQTIGGNLVTLDIGGGAKVFYGHLRPGGVLVKPGQRVKRGQVIGKLGDSGNSDAPHLHIHVADGATVLGAEGLPYVFDRFRIHGFAPSLEVMETPQGWPGLASAPSQPVARQLPIANAVVDFPD